MNGKQNGHGGVIPRDGVVVEAPPAGVAVCEAVSVASAAALKHEGPKVRHGAALEQGCEEEGGRVGKHGADHAVHRAAHLRVLLRGDAQDHERARHPHRRRPHDEEQLAEQKVERSPAEFFRVFGQLVDVFPEAVGDEARGEGGEGCVAELLGVLVIVLFFFFFFPSSFLGS